MRTLEAGLLEEVHELLDSELTQSRREMLNDGDPASAHRRVRIALNDVLGRLTGLDEAIGADANRRTATAWRERFRRRAYEWISLGDLCYWALAKPYNYAGDYRVIELIHDHDDEVSSFGKILDNCFYETEGPQAVPTRRRFVSERVTQHVRELDRPVTIANIGCGAAREAQDVVRAGLPAGSTHILIDTEPDALEVATTRLGPEASFEIRHENVLHYIRSPHDDLVPFLGRQVDVLYSVGVMDYIPERLFRALLPKLFRTLKPGGLCIIGNFDPSNESRAFMEWFLDWNLEYRTRDQLLGALTEMCPEAEDVQCVDGGTRVNHFLTFRRES